MNSTAYKIFGWVTVGVGILGIIGSIDGGTTLELLSCAWFAVAGSLILQLNDKVELLESKNE